MPKEITMFSLLADLSVNESTLVCFFGTTISLQTMTRRSETGGSTHTFARYTRSSTNTVARNEWERMRECNSRDHINRHMRAAQTAFDAKNIHIVIRTDSKNSSKRIRRMRVRCWSAKPVEECDLRKQSENTDNNIGKKGRIETNA